MKPLQLNLDDIKITFCIEEYDKEDWCTLTLKLDSDNITYCVEHDEMLEGMDLTRIKKVFNQYLKGEMQEERELSFTEPFFSFIVRPEKDEIEWKVYLCDKRGAFCDHCITLWLSEKEIRAIANYIELAEIQGR